MAPRTKHAGAPGPATQDGALPATLPAAPRATARLQLHGGFTFADAARTVDYYAALGVSHLYLSPICAARPGSTHGYDVTDPTCINPELGGEAGLAALVEAVHAAGLGLIVDIVPNHMAADATHNPWWRDVLAHGPGSRYARHFDIDWDSADPALQAKVLLPVLGEPYWQALSSGEIVLDTAGSAPVARCAGQDFPLDPATLPADPGALAALGAGCGTDPAGRERLHALLERQHYRLAWWRTAASELNWRRFFEISELVGVRVEDPAVFEDVHGLVLSLLARGWIDGVRVDHVDGLADPRGYCRALRERADAAAAEAHRAASAAATVRPWALARPWIVVEKILAEQETLPLDWLVDGTTGYDFMNEISAVLHDARGGAALDALWRQLASGAPSAAAAYDDIVTQARAAMLDYRLAAEYEAACRALHRVARAAPETRDISLASLRRAAAALLVRLDIYRTYYCDGRHPCEAQHNDGACLDAAARDARAHLQADDAIALEWVIQCIEGRLSGARAQPAATARRRLQQLMPPLAAKAEEDTAFYRYGRLLSRNEVGSRPDTLAFSVERFHLRMAARAQRIPHAMLATATHDHKRGEDTRLRIAALSESAEAWRRSVQTWESQRAPAVPGPGGHGSTAGPDGPDRLMLYQMCVGAWPVDPARRDMTDLQARLLAWQQKAIREAKRHGSWIDPDEPYEAQSADFLRKLLADAEAIGIAEAAASVDIAAAVAGLTQTLVQLTAPGVPDRYQGAEVWDQSLVDPDNRRPVDFARLRALLACTAGWEEWLRGWRDGRIKLQLIRAVLQARLECPAVFLAGGYRGLPATGPLARHALAFERCLAGDGRVIVVGTRLATGQTEPGVPRVRPAAWDTTRILLQTPGAPDTHAGSATTAVGVWRDLLTGARHRADQGALALAEVLKVLPVALLTPA